LLGLVGAVIGGLLFQSLLGVAATSLIGQVISAFLGALILIVLVRLVEGRRNRLSHW
jgi:uncharacterized membrane protein YeaQ/YmgE (transglycosylase-associated protein family)